MCMFAQVSSFWGRTILVTGRQSAASATAKKGGAEVTSSAHYVPQLLLKQNNLIIYHVFVFWNSLSLIVSPKNTSDSSPSSLLYHFLCKNLFLMDLN